MGDETPAATGALTGFLVLDLTNELAAYASRLLGDLGADVIRIEPPGGSRTRSMEPLLDGDDGRSFSAFDAFVNAGKRSITLDLTSERGRALFRRLVVEADVVIETFPETTAVELGVDNATLAALNPRLVHVSVTPFGRDRTSANVDDDDLTIMAAGGLLHFGGYADSEPVVAYGGQARNAASLFAAVATLTALLEREASGKGRWVDVSAQECVAQALEDSVPTYQMTGRIRRRLGPDAAEAGSGVYPCADGFVSMIAGRVGTAKAWRSLVEWLIESEVPGAVALREDRWSTIAYRQTPAAIEEFSRVFATFTASRGRLELYREAQRRGIALSPVNDMSQLLEDPQLAARGFWVRVLEPELGREVTFPGPPYRLSRTPALRARPAPRLGADNGILAENLVAPGVGNPGLRELERKAEVA
jgi:benzylsuccinate CoA-transferase BbsE subunit